MDFTEEIEERKEETLVEMNTGYAKEEKDYTLDQVMNLRIKELKIAELEARIRFYAAIEKHVRSYIGHTW